MHKKIITFAAFLTLAATDAQAGFEVACPATISVDQSLSRPAGKWTSRIDTINKSILLDEITLYDGPPEELASLKPDNGDSQDVTMVWTLGPSPRGYYIECRYRNTAVTLVRKIPIQPKQCKLTYEKDAGGTLSPSDKHAMRCQ